MKTIIKTLFFLLIFVVNFALPIYQVSFDIPTILTSISLLFAILIGFFMAAATSNYLSLQKTISNEDSCLISVYELVKMIQPRSAKKVARVIDDYMIRVLDYELLDYAANTNREFDALLKVVDEVCLKDKSKNQLIPNLQSVKMKLINLRMESMLATQRIVTKKHWFILIILSAVLSFLLVSLRDSMFSSLIVAVIIIAIYQVLSLLHEIDSNIFLSDKFGYGAEPQAVFRAIGMLEYYPETALKLMRKNELSNKYRVGNYVNYPVSFEKKIKTINQSNNKSDSKK